MTIDLVPADHAVGLPADVTLHTTGLALPDDLRFNDWKRIGETIAVQGNTLQWAIGDWLAYGDRYRRDYASAMQEIDRSYQTMRNLAYVASSIHLSRRRDNLSFTHHAEVASLDPDMQTVWLDDALRQGWSTRELRAEVQAWKTGQQTPVHGAPSRSPAPRVQAVASPVSVTINADPDRYSRWERAAQSHSVDVIEWAAKTLDVEAQITLEGEAA